MATAYKGATNEVQQKLRRVIEVWRQRVIFEPDIQEIIENRVNGRDPLSMQSHLLLTRLEIDKSRSSGKKSLLGGFSASSSGSSAPSELQPIVSSQIAVSKLALAFASTSSTANVEYDKLTDANAPALSPPVQAARLSSLFKTLANAEGAVSESIKARETLIGGLEQLLETNRTVLARERIQQGELASRKTTIEARKRDVESAILRGLDSDPRSHSNGDSLGPRNNDQDETKTSSTIEAEPPQMEELTPPPIGSLTPPGPFYVNGNTGINTAELESAHGQEPALVASPFVPPYAQCSLPAGADLLSSFSVPTTRPYPASPTNGGSTKKRRIESENESEGEDAMAGLDEDVAELLRAESGAR